MNWCPSSTWSPAGRTRWTGSAGGWRSSPPRRWARHKTAAVRCGGEALWAAQTADVDISPMNLQQVFVTLCGHEPAAV